MNIQRLRLVRSGSAGASASLSCSAPASSSLCLLPRFLPFLPPARQHCHVCMARR